MAKRKLHNADPIQNQIPRRTMLSLPVVAGGILLVNEPMVAAGAGGIPCAITPQLIKENTTAADSLALYTNLLPEVRRFELARSLQGLDVRRFDDSIDSIHSLLLNASADFLKAKQESTTPAERIKLRADGAIKLEDAISKLKKLLGREVNEALLETPLERLIVLLLGVRVVEGGPMTANHHASYGGIMEVLKANIKPGSWIQLGIGYAVAFPVLIRNREQSIREKLLMDGLRLVPGLVPSPLIDTAKQLSVLTL